MLLPLTCRGLLKVALQHQGQTLEEEDMETRYLATPLYLGPRLWVAALLGKTLSMSAIH